MTLQEIEFLHLTNKLTGKTESSFFYDESDLAIHLSNNYNAKKQCNRLAAEINSLFNELLKNGYLELLPTIGLNPPQYRLTQRGLHFFQFSLNILVEFALKSIIVPIIVAFITALFVSA